VPYKYKTTATQLAERYWACWRCGAGGEVQFKAIGASGWHEDSLIGDDGLVKAGEAAESDLMVDADAVLQLVRCPTCHARGKGALGRGATWAALPSLAGVAAAIASGWIWIPIGGGLVVSGILGWRMLSRIRRANLAFIYKLQPGKLPEPEAPRPKPAPKPAPRPKPQPQLPPARAIVAPPVEPTRPRDPDEGPAFLKSKPD
jgi:hypothetical protein